MSLKHTPGPWTMFSADAVFPRYGFPVEAANGRSIALVTYFRDVDPDDVPAAPREETRANAVLIAAAPDLAAACRPALAKAAIDRLRNLAEAAIAIGDRKDGAALAMLLEWHERARAAYPEGFLEGLAALLASGAVVTVTLFAAVVFGAVR